MSNKGKKKKRTKVTNISQGDTVKLSKGRLGLVRFIGKTQFGLGEWIGIELYNELIKTRHNGAVLGKRYFRCPANRGIFVRRSLIRENVPVPQIQSSLNKLREKEKKMRKDRKQKTKSQRNAKKAKNEEKRAAKAAKIQAKYEQKSVSKSPPPSTKPNKFKPPQISTSSSATSNERKRSKKAAKTPTYASNPRRLRLLNSNSSTKRSRSANPPPDRDSSDKSKSSKATRKGSKPKTPKSAKKSNKRLSLKKASSTKSPPKKTKHVQTKKAQNGKRRAKIDWNDSDDSDEPIAAPLQMAVAQPLEARKYDKKAETTSNITKTSKNKKRSHIKKSNSTDLGDVAKKIKQKFKITPKNGKKNKKKTPSKPPKLTKSTSNPEASPNVTPIPSPGTPSADSIESVGSSAPEPSPSITDDSPSPVPEPDAVPQIAPPQYILDAERKKVAENDYKLKGFNTNFKDSLRSRKGNDSLQLLRNKKKKQEELKKVEQRRKDKANKKRQSHVKESSIQIFDNTDMLPSVIDNIEDDVDHKKVRSPKGLRKRNKVSMDSADGNLDSDDSLNEESEDDDELKKELEQEFEQNFEKFHDVLDEYTHTIDDIEASRKKLADNIVSGVRQRRRSRAVIKDNARISPFALPQQQQQQIDDVDMNAAFDSTSFANNNDGGSALMGGSGMGSFGGMGGSSFGKMGGGSFGNSYGRSGFLGTYNDPNSVFGAPSRGRNSNNFMMKHSSHIYQGVRVRRKSQMQFQSARSRRGSSFVDDYNVNDTLFFDGDDENQNVKADPDEFFVDDMGDSDPEEDDIKDPTDLTTTTIEEEDEEEECDMDDVEDPLLGTIEDILEEDEDEENMDGFEPYEPPTDTRRRSGIIESHTESANEAPWDMPTEPRRRSGIVKMDENQAANGQQWESPTRRRSGIVQLESEKKDNKNDSITTRRRSKMNKKPISELKDAEEHEEESSDEEEMKIFDIEEDGGSQKVVIFYVELSEFLKWESYQNGYGMRVSKIEKNDYGEALKIETGVESGWMITKINEINVTERKKAYIQRKLNQCDEEEGYKITFVRAARMTVVMD